MSSSAFLSEMVAQSESDSGLMVVAAGLGSHIVTARLVENVIKKQEGLVLVLNTNDECEALIDWWLYTRGGGELVKVPGETKPKVREEIYGAAHVCSVASRVLIPDILQGRLNPLRLKGCLVWDAHRVDNVDAPEAFILRLLKERAPHMYIRAITESPDSFIRRGLKLDTLLRCLCVNKVFMWPRFHIRVEECLKLAPLEVIEMQCKMPKGAAQVQNTLIKIIDDVVEELGNRLEKMLPAGGGGDAALTSTGVITGLLGRFLREELGTRVGRLSQNVRTLLDELEVLKRLLRLLHTTTCIEFFEAVEHATFYAEGQLTGDIIREPSNWLMSSHAKYLIPHAKARIFRGNKLHLEKDPKFAILSSIIADINKDWANGGPGMNSLAPGATFTAADRPTVLVLVKDRHTRFVVSHMLQKGEERVMNKLLQFYVDENYTQERTAASQLQEYRSRDDKTPGSKGSRGSKGSGASPVVGRSVLAEIVASAPEAPIPQGACDIGEGDEVTEAVQEDVTELCDLNDGYSSDDSFCGSVDSLEKEAEVAAAPVPETPDKQTPKRKRQPDQKEARKKAKADIVKTERELLLAEMDKYLGIFGAGTGPNILVHTIHNSANLLEETKPSWVILYDPSIVAIRRLEVYAACHTDWLTKVYVCGNSDSTEQQKTLTEISNEVNAFKWLAAARAKLPDYGQATPNRELPSPYLPKAKSKRSGLLKAIQNSGKIIIDHREFRSKLPSALQRRDATLVPQLLDVADYVLSPDIGIERKSIPDLMGSLSSGRLLSQVERLTKKYKIPVLLIEFDTGRPFSLIEGESWHKQQHGSRRQELNWSKTMNNFSGLHLQCIEKLASLSVLYPSLLIWWSRDQSMTAKLFEDAKQGRPDPCEADTTEEVTHSQAATNMLLKMPGVTPGNIGTLTSAFTSIADLATATKERLTSLIGEGGGALYNFLHST
eukprot:TRINITY_DN14958_c0_g1_i1.p1 TRINITY_DN14958_c0_g1~~TRINITY_DN14958_c0_g1_i1.p1  ORF type:complete len:945 (+),score=280.71 TRINITY_DN14958_c0_g1_i1:695-3529(+)